MCSILKDSDFNTVAHKISSLNRNKLCVKVLLKDHKLDFLLRVVVSEKGTWQSCLSDFAQHCLCHLKLLDSLALKNTEELLIQLLPFHGKSVCLFH